MCSTFGAYEAHEEVFGLKMMAPERNPLLFAWITTLKEHPLMKGLQPPHDKLVETLQFIKRAIHARGSESH